MPEAAELRVSFEERPDGPAYDVSIAAERPGGYEQFVVEDTLSLEWNNGVCFGLETVPNVLRGALPHHTDGDWIRSLSFEDHRLRVEPTGGDVAEIRLGDYESTVTKQSVVQVVVDTAAVAAEEFAGSYCYNGKYGEFLDDARAMLDYFETYGSLDGFEYERSDEAVEAYLYYSDQDTQAHDLERVFEYVRANDLITDEVAKLSRSDDDPLVRKRFRDLLYTHVHTGIRRLTLDALEIADVVDDRAADGLLLILYDDEIRTDYTQVAPRAATLLGAIGGEYVVDGLGQALAKTDSQETAEAIRDALERIGTERALGVLDRRE